MSMQNEEKDCLSKLSKKYNLIILRVTRLAQLREKIKMAKIKHNIPIKENF